MAPAMRLIARVALMAAALAFCLPLHLLWKLLGLRPIWPRIFLAAVARIAGLRVAIDGKPLREKVLFVSNHVSWLDILALGGATGSAFVSRDDVAKWPLVGWLADQNDTLYVARGSRQKARGQADLLREVVASGRAVALFPEGTTEGGEEILPFRPSLFASLFPTLPGIRVQPVALDYGREAGRIAWVGEEPAGTNARRILARRGSLPVTLRFLDPIDPASAGDRKRLAIAAETAIATALSLPTPSRSARDAFEAGADPLYGDR